MLDAVVTSEHGWAAPATRGKTFLTAPHAALPWLAEREGQHSMLLPVLSCQIPQVNSQCSLAQRVGLPDGSPIIHGQVLL